MPISEHKRFQAQETAKEPSERSSTFIATYTGIEPSQLLALDESQQEKVFLGLWKQLDLAASMHGQQTKQNLKTALERVNNAPL